MSAPQTNVLKDYARAFVALNGAHAADGPALAPDRLKEAINSFYDHLAAGAPPKFWNWGVYSEDLERELRARLPEFDRLSDGFSEQLYFSTVHAAKLRDTSGLSVLDVGCGVGEGLNFIARTHDFKTLVGLDQAPAAIRRANAQLARTNMRFVVGEAEKLPFPTETFDLVINVESSHNYPSLPTFFAEVSRVLKPGGWFSCADALTAERREVFSRARAASPLDWVAEHDISAQVKASISRRIYPERFGRPPLRFPPPGSLSERIFRRQRWLLIAGAPFAGHQFDPLFRLFMKTQAQFEFKTYEHFLARRKG